VEDEAVSVVVVGIDVTVSDAAEEELGRKMLVPSDDEGGVYPKYRALRAWLPGASKLVEKTARPELISC
jgi:hypothetical protein